MFIISTVIYNTISCMYMYMCYMYVIWYVCLYVSISGETGEIYDAPPTRPMKITDMDKHSCDIAIDDNTRIVLSLDVFHQPEETAVRVSD